MSSPDPLPVPLPEEISRSAKRGELQKVVKWLRRGGLVDAFSSVTTRNGRASTAALLHLAATNDHLEMARMLLKRGASVDLLSSLGTTALMGAASLGHLSILLVLLQHSASPNLQEKNGCTALMKAASEGQGACVQALLCAKANTELLDNSGGTALQWAEAKGHTAIAELIRQHAAPPQPAAVSAAAPPDAGEPAESAPASLPDKIYESAQRGKLQTVIKWLRKGGPVDALCVSQGADGQPRTYSLLHAAAGYDHLEMVRELLKRGASVDLQGSLSTTALMGAAYRGHLSIVLLLLQHSANPDLQSYLTGRTALMIAATTGQEA